MALRSVDLVPGATIDYFSSAKDSWLTVKIKSVNSSNGDIEIDIRKGTVIPKAMIDGKCRRHTVPSKTQLEWARQTMGSDAFAVEQARLFERHAVMSPDGRQKLVYGKKAIADLANDLDLSLGTVGSILVLEDETESEPDPRDQGEQLLDTALTLRKFGYAFWTLLHKLLQQHGDGLHVKRGMSCKGKETAKDYDVIKELAGGSFGKVRLVIERKSGLKRAVKVMQKRPSMTSQLEAEVQTLCTVDHPNIVKLRCYYEDETTVCLVMDFCDGGELAESLPKMGRADDEMLLHLSSQLMRAVAHVHNRGIIHCDIKGQNIMLMNSMGTVAPSAQRNAKPCSNLPHLMLIDLGVAQLFRPGTGGEIAGTPSTMAPEAWQGHITPAADVFSCGVVMYEIASLDIKCIDIRSRPNYFDQIAEGMQFWRKGLSPFTWKACRNVGAPAVKLMQSMCSLRRQERPSAQEVLASEFMKKARLPVATILKDEKVNEAIKQMMRYAPRTLLYKSIAFAMARKWQSNQLPTIHKIFNMFDATGAGLLDVNGAREGLLACGLQPAGAQAVVNAMDLNNDGSVDWTEFVAACINFQSPGLEEALEGYFMNASGKSKVLDRSGLAKLLPGYKEKDPVVEKLFKEIGKGSSGISWSQFRDHFIRV